MFYWRPPWNISIFLLQISLDRFDGSTGYYLYDARGSVSGITNEEGQVYQSYRYSVTGEITFGAPQYENEYTYNGESYNPNIQSQYLRARYYCVVTATFLTEDSYLGNQTEPLTLNRYNYCVSSYLNYTDPSGNRVEVNENLKGWIRDPDTQAQKTIENYENQRLSIEDAIESGLLNNRAGQIFLDYGDVVMGPAVKPPADIIVIRETVKGNSDSKEMQRTATAGFYAGFVGQGIEYTQIISNADYQLSLLIVTQKGLNAAANPLTYVEYFRNFSPQEKLEAAKRTAKGAWNGEYDSALGRKIGAAILDYLLVAIGGALMKGENAACEVAESGSGSVQTISNKFPNDNQAGKRFDYITENGRVHIENGVQNVDFVMDMGGNLHIGRGHSYLAGGSSVQAAGTMKVNSQGYIRLITNESGHFQPTTVQAMNYPTVFRNAGLNIDNAWIRIGEFETSMSNYVIDSNVLYNGPIKNMP